jgi:predicted 3-demethylubiquinone-9 3-methyltransferase (glyoxalase superfamily)
MQSITPFLWFDNNVEEAIDFYASVFKDFKSGSVSRTGEKAKVMVASFSINGQEFIALNGGPQFKFTEAISFVINCETQEEVDHYWDKLSEGGEKSRCGWLKDPFGLSWQVVPTILGKLMSDKDPQKSKRVMETMMQMDKLDIAKLKQAYEG